MAEWAKRLEESEMSTPADQLVDLLRGLASGVNLGGVPCETSTGVSGRLEGIDIAGDVDRWVDYWRHIGFLEQVRARQHYTIVDRV